MSNVEPAAVDLVIRFEEGGTFRAEVGLDPVGNWEIGYGSIWDWRNSPPTRVIESTPPVDEATARAFLAKELEEDANEVDRLVTVSITHNVRAALQDFAFNEGTGALARSTLLRELNAGNPDWLNHPLAEWDIAGGKRMSGLDRRRAAERSLALAPDASSV